jgi:hypothetical protein
MTTQTFTSGQILTAAQMTTLQSNSGLQLIKSETAVSASASATADSVFTSAYTNYLVMINFTTSTNNALKLRLRTGGSPAISNYNQQTLLSTVAVVAGSQVTAQSSFDFDFSNGDFKSSIILNINNPQLAQATGFIAQMQLQSGSYTTGTYVFSKFGNHSTATSYDGFDLITSTGTWSGNYTVYGYGKTV